MAFDTFFRASSYAMVASGALVLALSGGLGAGLAGLFLVLLAVAWQLEGRRWQLSERAGLVVLLLALPLVYFDWKFHSNFVVSENGVDGRAQAGITVLVHLTLFLSAIKLLQVKADRDWLFLYLISFFEVMLAAGLSISPVFVAALGLYMFSALLTIVCFELRKARRHGSLSETKLLVAHDAKMMKWLEPVRDAAGHSRVVRRLPLAALCLLILIFTFALPIFFVAPRFSNSALALTGGGSAGYVGFSDHVTLGDIGRLQQNNGIVMRVRVDDPQLERHRNLRWRGVALDQFSGLTWRRSAISERIVPAGEQELFQLGTTEHLNRITTQTFFLEPIDTPVLFVAPRALALQGPLPVVRRDSEDALTTRYHPQERLSYRVYSDTVEPPEELLRADFSPNPRGLSRYEQLPEKLHPRIKMLASEWINEAGASNRYDMARAIETHLKNDFGYTLEMRAGGDEPLADFLFRVREGHCEYFSTAMAVMLRTQGIAARVVNGFQIGEYNDAADAYTVRQSDAHSWVEVYFPETASWVTFDPTPPAGRTGSGRATGLRGQLNKYTEALELFWIQYVVAYDRQEQRSLVNSLRSSWSASRSAVVQNALRFKAKLLAWWELFSSGATTGIFASRSVVPVASLLLATLVILLFLFWHQIRRFNWRRALTLRSASVSQVSAINFYERMAKTLEAQGFRRSIDQTPLEFATATGIPEALVITRAYHRVRYGADELPLHEVAEIESCLRKMEETPANIKGHRE